MSSILDALKKAERESLEGDGKDSPWPVPAVDRSAKSKYRRRLTIPLGVIVGLLLMVSLYWTTRQPAPDPRQSVDSKPAMEPVPFENTRSASLPLPKAPPLTHREGPPRRLLRHQPVCRKTGPCLRKRQSGRIRLPNSHYPSLRKKPARRHAEKHLKSSLCPLSRPLRHRCGSRPWK